MVIHYLIQKNKVFKRCDFLVKFQRGLHGLLFLNKGGLKHCSLGSVSTGNFIFFMWPFLTLFVKAKMKTLKT